MSAQAARLVIEGLPQRCPECHEAHTEWRLTAHLGMVQVACPSCWVALLPVVAVAATGRETGQ